jgi:hypothetical protein
MKALFDGKNKIMVAVLSKRTLMLILFRRRWLKKNRNKKQMWVRKLLRERKTKGEFYLLVQDLRLFDDEYFFKYFRMSATQYEEILSMVAPLFKNNLKNENV